MILAGLLPRLAMSVNTTLSASRPSAARSARKRPALCATQPEAEATAVWWQVSPVGRRGAPCGADDDV